MTSIQSKGSTVPCESCLQPKTKSEIGHISFTDRNASGGILERKIIRICRECLEKERQLPKKK